MCLNAKNLCVRYGSKHALNGVDMALRQGQALAVLGRNGAGKTTLFRTILNFIKPEKGSVTIDGQDVSAISRKALSRQIAYVPQSSHCTFPYSVLEIVTMGRHCRKEGMREPTVKDMQKAKQSLKTLGIAHLAHRKVRSLSGGEKQLSLIARALTQQPKIMVMDEPTASLDMHNAVMVLRQILLLKKQGISVLVTTHSASQAKVFADRVLMLKNGEVFADGDASLLSSSETLHALYNIDTGEGDEVKLREFIAKAI